MLVDSIPVVRSARDIVVDQFWVRSYGWPKLLQITVFDHQLLVNESKRTLISSGLEVLDMPKTYLLNAPGNMNLSWIT